ncbi:MAG: hypothetical protein COA44_06875 [Arcobacter sp.]|nr:MAG: hypothetical protein COA44_06875 [Arcobacter sp.]
MSENLEETPEKLYYDPLSVARRTSQKIHLVNEHDKDALLTHLIKNNEYTGVIVLTKTKRKADEVCKHLQENDIKALSIHSNKGSEDCAKAVASFHGDETTALIMTDTTLEAQSFEVINQMISYNIPHEASQYYARLVSLEEKGEGIALVSEEEQGLMDAIQLAMKVEILEVEVEGFTSTDASELKDKPKKDKSKKPRHKKSKTKKDSKKKDNE